MSPIYLNPQPSSTIPFLELKGDNNINQQQNTFQVFGYLHGEHLETSSNNSSFSYNSHNRLNSREMFSLDYARHDEVKIEKLVLSYDKTSDLGQPNSSWLQSAIGDENCGNSYAYSINNLQKDQTIQNVNNNNDHKYSRKWKSSKVKIMQKMMTKTKNSRDGNKQQLDLHQPKRQSCDVIRTCTDCHTTTTPLWRSGPQGPKSLCNACGIRQRKVRRAAMAAATAAAAATTTDYLNDAMVPSISLVEAPKTKAQVTKSEKGFDHDKNRTLPLKKRSKIIHASKNDNNYNNYTNNSHNNPKNICFEDFTLSSNKDHFKANTKRSFPRDEEEGAILLMALSCGLACSSY